MNAPRFKVELFAHSRDHRLIARREFTDADAAAAFAHRIKSRETWTRITPLAVQPARLWPL